jgi:pimeloyl-ACP methyl ester carboxylesterase
MKLGGSEFIGHTVPLDEGRLAFLCRHRPGPALVLIPGSFNDASEWEDVVARLDENLALVIVELRGHGGSWPPPRKGSIGQFASDVLMVVDELGLKRFYVGGHSIGGMVALEVARVRAEGVLAAISVEGWTNHRAPREAFPDSANDTPSPALRARIAEIRGRVTARWSAEELQAFGKIWRMWDGYEFLCSTGTPILEVYGDRGREKPPLAALYIPVRPNITVRWIEGASHYLPLERPVEVAQAFMEFIGRSDRGPQRA